MPYSSVEALPSSFKNLPEGAKTIAMRTMNAVLEGKTETEDLVTQALQAAWAQIKRKYKRGEGGKWVAKSALLTIAPEGLTVVHGVLKEEMGSRGLPHDTPWVTEKMAALGEGRGAGGPRQGVGGSDWCVCPDCGHRVKHDRGAPCIEVTCSECGATMVGEGTAGPTAKSTWSKVIKADDEQQTIAGVVYMADDALVQEWVAKGSPEDRRPEVVDTDDDWITEDNLRQSFGDFMSRVDRISRSGDVRPFGIGHRVLAPDMSLLQAALLYKGTSWPEPDTEPLSAQLNWVQQLHIENKSTWEEVKQQNLTGFSLEGLALR